MDTAAKEKEMEERLKREEEEKEARRKEVSQPKVEVK